MTSWLTLVFVSALVGYCSATPRSRDANRKVDKLIESILDEIIDEDQQNNKASRQQLQLSSQFNAGNEFYGVAHLGSKVYTISDHSSVVKVWGDDPSHTRQADIPVDGLDYPMDMAADPQTNRLFVLEKHPNRNVWRIDAATGSATKLIPGVRKYQGMTLSVNGNNVIVTSVFRSQLFIYDANTVNTGEPQSIVQLPDWMIPLHAVQLSNGHFIVCHVAARGEFNADGVTEVDAEGRALKTYGGQRGSGPNQLNKPQHLAVKPDGGIVVADFENRRVVGIDAGLTTSTVYCNGPTCRGRAAATTTTRAADRGGWRSRPGTCTSASPTARSGSTASEVARLGAGRSDAV